ncbi:MAG: AgmX/PglI C-terminal domain-containing protein [Archangiaceae bacterium]|nr:AgmX/PglI C-terminal domain-containing protein [Archangiaceae bacterium]
MSAHLTPEQLEAPGVDASSHLQGCAECRAGVRRAQGRQKLLKGLKAHTLADVAFSRVEARLMEHVRENPPGPRFTFGRLAAFAALAMVAALFAVTTVRPLFDGKGAAAPVAAFQPMTVMFAAKVPGVKAGDVLNRGAVVAAAGGRVELSTADGLQLRVSGGAQFTLAPNEQATVAVNHGTLGVDARMGTWVVAYGNTWVRISDAQLDFAPDALSLYRGTAVLADNASFENAKTVSAPARVSLPAGRVGSLDGKVSVMRKGSPPPWAKLELDLDAQDVELDGQSVGAAPLSLLALPGAHHLRARVGDEWRETDVDLHMGAPGVVSFPEKVTVAPLLPAVKTGPVVEADPAAIAAAVKAQLPKLRVCHEKWLKVNESARGKVLMSVTVSPRGKVTRATFAADEGVPEAVNECLGRAVRQMKLPASSEEVDLEIPVLLGAQ